MKKIIYILGYWIYFIGEGVTEALTWQMDQKIINPDYYHLWRVVENLGLIIIILLLIFVKKVRNIWISILAATSGLALYEFVFRQVGYGDWKYYKSAPWLGIPNPNYQLWLVIFIISVIGIILIMFKNRKYNN
jgi:Flp pilus assembly protein protease CpaA